MNKAVKIVLAIVIVLVIACGAFAWYIINSMQTNDAKSTQSAATAAPEETAAVEATPEPGPAEVITVDASATEEPVIEAAAEDEQIVNILLTGSDARIKNNTDPEGRSDTMMVASLDKKNKKLTLVSFMRDLEVKRMNSRGGFSFNGKLNAAYQNGGVDELMKTLNYNFGLNLDQYLSVGFEGFEMLVDEIGGLVIHMTAEECYYNNWRRADQYDYGDKKNRFAALEGMGKPIIEETEHDVMCGGEMALWYARDRTTGTAEGTKGSDFTRINRQQYVIKLIYQKIKNEMSLSTVVAVMNFAKQYIATNMAFDDMVELAGFIYSNDVEIVSISVPYDKTWSYGKDEETGEKNGLVVIKNFKKTAQRLQEDLYGAAATPTPNPDADDSDS